MDKKCDLKAIRQRIKMLRGNNTQKNFAKMLGVHQTTLSQVEQGLVKPSFELLFALSNQCNTTFDFIFTGQNEPPHIEEKIGQRTEGYKIALQAKDEQIETKDQLIKNKDEQIVDLKQQVMMEKNNNYMAKNV